MLLFFLGVGWGMFIWFIYGKKIQEQIDLWMGTRRLKGGYNLDVMQQSVIVLCFVVYSSFAIILMAKRELVALLSLSSKCLVIVVWPFLVVPRVCLQFVIVVFPDHTYLLFLQRKAYHTLPYFITLINYFWTYTSSVLNVTVVIVVFYDVHINNTPRW